MSIEYRFEEDLLEIVVVGDHTVEEFARCVEMAQADARWPGTAWLLIDVTESSSVTRRTPQELREVVSFFARRPGTFRYATALLVSSSMQDERLRVAVQMADFNGTEVRTFFRRADAVRWLRGTSPHPPLSGRGASAQARPVGVS